MFGFYIVTTGLQCVAALLALRLVRFTRRDIGWGLLAAALMLACLRRVVGIASQVMGYHSLDLDPHAEWISFFVSVLLIAGIFLVTPFFNAAQRAMDVLKASEAQERAFLDAVPDLLFHLDIDGKYLGYRSSKPELLIFPPESFLGRKIADLYPPAAAEKFMNALRAAIREQRMVEVEYTLPKDGKIRHRETHIVALNDREALAVVRDITDRKQAEEALLNREEQYRAIFETASDGMAVFTFDGTLVTINPSGCRMLDMAQAQEGCLQLPEIVHAKSRPQLAELMELVRQGKTFQKELEGLRKDGTTFPAEVTATRFNYFGQSKVLVVVRDFSEKRRAEQERGRLEAQLQQAQKLESLGVLAGGIAHDFNNLLTGVIGNASLALMDLPAESAVRPSLKQIELAAQRAADLTKQLLAYAGKGRFLIQPLSLSKVIQEMADLLQAVTSKKAIVKYDFANDLPDILADATQVRQVVMNLITNASDAIGDLSGVIRIGTGVMFAESSYLTSAYVQDELPQGYYVVMEVSDTGCGMDYGTLQRIFDPFFTTKFTGRGLGLAAVLGIMRGHKGTIKVYSEPRKGSTFKVLFPIAAKAESSPAESKQPESPWRGQGVILIVDDEETVRAVAKRTLESYGFQTVLADHGLDALEKFRSRPNEISCVLLDLTMPRMGGEETFRELRLMQPNVKVVLMSGYNEQEVSNQFAGKGLAGFIQKPFRATELLGIIRQTLETK